MRPSALRILVVDDEPAQREILRAILRDGGHEVSTAESGNRAIAQLRSGAFDLIVTDLRMPDGDGLDVLREARRTDPDVTILLMTAYATVSNAVEAMRDGAYDFLQKPFQKEELVERVRRVAERRALVRENRRLLEELRAQVPVLVGESPVMARVRRQIERLATVPGDVLLTGESGTGKELAARALHYGGSRAAGPFVAINCAAIPEGLAESELFGHEKGAFTHATTSREGRFEQADGGTLFLDEISSMELGLQAKLLRVLQDRIVERVGSPRTRSVDVRVIAAANRDLPSLVQEGKFREDLFHRLNVHELHLPPLRERGEDIVRLAELFRDQAAARVGAPPPGLAPELLEFLRRYSFPGNVRELAHMMEKMVVLSEGDALTLDDLPPSVWRQIRAAEPNARAEHGAPPAHSGAGPQPEDLLRGGPISFFDLEERLIREALRRSNGNISEAARQLGMSYKTLRYRVGKFGVDSTERD